MAKTKVDGWRYYPTIGVGIFACFAAAAMPLLLQGPSLGIVLAFVYLIGKGDGGSQ